MPILASFRLELVNFPSEKGRFGCLLRSLHFGSNRLKLPTDVHLGIRFLFDTLCRRGGTWMVPQKLPL